MNATNLAGMWSLITTGLRAYPSSSSKLSHSEYNRTLRVFSKEMTAISASESWKMLRITMHRLKIVPTANSEKMTTDYAKIFPINFLNTRQMTRTIPYLISPLSENTNLAICLSRLGKFPDLKKNYFTIATGLDEFSIVVVENLSFHLSH